MSLTIAQLDLNPHAAMHKDGGEDELSVEELATSGEAGTVPVSDGLGGVEMGFPAVLEALQTFLIVRKGSAGTILKGQPVYVSGYNPSGWIEVELAKADAAGTMPAIGLAKENITNLADAHVVISGTLIGTDTSSWSVEDAVYVSAATAGQLTNTKPTGHTNFVQKMGLVVESDDEEGKILVIGAGRTNDVPNLQEDYVWKGNASGVATPTKSVFGDEWDWDEDNTLRSTTVEPPSWYTAHTFNTATLPAGTYRIGWHYSWAIDSISDDFMAQVVVDGTTTIESHVQESKDAGTNQVQPASGFNYVTFATEAAHAIILQIATESGDDSHVHNSRFEIWRVS